MSEGETRENPFRWIEVAVVVFGPLLGIAVGWWLSAQGARDEALRADRREAYASMVAVSADCGGGAAVGRSQEVAADVARDPQFADVFDSPEAQALLEELTTHRAATASALLGCRVPARPSR